MTFLNPLFLIGLAASALPVLFHLFARRKSRRVEFSSLRFLQKLEKTSMRAVKVRQILLLIVRTLLVTAVVLAFARPALRGYLGGFFGSSHANTSMVFLIDNSASMSRSDDRGELLKQSKEAAISLVGALGEGDEATIIPLASIERGKEYRPVHTKREVLAEINDVHMADRGATLPDGLRMASAVLAQSHNVNKEVYLFSDAQARNLKETQGGPAGGTLPQSDTSKAMKLFDASTKFFTMTVGQGERLNGRNLSLDSLKPVTTVFEPGRPISFEAWVRNTTTEAASNAVLSLFYNGDRVAQKTIPAISANATERVEIQGPLRGSGRVAVRAELEPDALPFDNARFAVIDVPSSRRIGIFTQDPGSATFVTLALSQTLVQSQTGMPFTTEVRRMQELRSLASFPDRYDAIFVLLGPTTLEEADRAALKSFLASGRGAGIFLMPGLDIAAASKDMTALGLPQILRKDGTPNDATHYQSFAQFDFAHPFFSGMFEAISTTGGALRGIESPKVFESYAVQPNIGLALIKLSNGAPFLSEIPTGKGDVLLFAAPPTMQFSDLPRKSIFLPLIRRAAAYASAVHSRADENVAERFVTTEPFDVDLSPLAGVGSASGGQGVVASTVLIKAPDGTSERAPVVTSAEGRSRIHVEHAVVAGNYTVYRDAEAREPIGAFAVNITSDESDLRATSDKDMQAYLAARMTGSVGAGPRITQLAPGAKDLAKIVDQSRYGVELWQSLLMAALILAIIELIIAREAKPVLVAARA
ncbi:MAG: BatA domain-containing protein [Bacteroidota bacterium]|nr:BatA domain-containing protein [Bacteroidota bacterium]MDP4234381.1 BatA domain-containing protein [Bacteroidota bacterium]MDP4243314.1 BatA domain-containing protein [Bacteroidota bacterium]MDP4287999.1 BatA domain-containing protein [Bacteroidota bacterium]